MWGAVIGAGLSLGSQYLLNRNSNRTQLQQQQALNNMSQQSNMAMLNAQQQSQYENWLRTNYSEQVNQLQKAGLNPAMLYGMSGGSGASMGNASGGNFQSQAGKDTENKQLGLNMVSQIMQNALLKSQKDNLDADTEVKKANAEKITGVDTALSRSQIDVNTADIKQIESMTKYTDVKAEGQSITNTLLDLQKQYEEGTLNARILNSVLENSKLQLEIDKLDAEMPFVAKIAKATLENLKQATNTAKSVESLNKEKTSAQEFENTEEQRGLRTAKLDAESSKILAEYGLTAQKLKDYVEKGIIPEGFDGRFMSIINRIIESIRK